MILTGFFSHSIIIFENIRAMRYLRLCCIMSLVVSAVAFISSCNSNGNKKSGTNLEEFKKVASHQDTVRAMEMTKAFMDMMQQGRTDEAIGALYSYTTINDTIEVMNDKDKDNLKKQFATFPVLEYEVETSEYKADDLATVTYKYKFMENPTNDPNYPCNVRLTLAVRRVMGQYYLCLYDHKVF